jgi:hypothetical protein
MTSTHLCCQGCRLRFSPGAATYLVECPECGEPPQSSSVEGLLGFRMFTVEDVPQPLPEAVAVSMPVPGRTARILEL